MSHFFLIDQSLKGVGGHHFDYTQQVSRAALQSGCDVTVGANRKFTAAAEFPGCQVRNLFRNSTYAPSSRMIGIRDMVAKRKPSIWEKMKRLYSRGGSGSPANDGLNESIAEAAHLSRNRQKRIDTFARDCQKFFELPMNEQDVVFFTTLSDLEAQGLTEFISRRSDAMEATWHLQFHFPLFRGRTAQYASQMGQLDRLRPVFRKLKFLATESRMHFYVTSQTLKEQYDHLGLDFINLAYPIDPVFHSGTDARIQSPSPAKHDQQRVFRVAFAGGIRAEKGNSEFKTLIDETLNGPDDETRSGDQVDFRSQVRFLVQKKKPKWLKRLRKQVFQKLGLESNTRDGEQDCFESVPFPLPANEYQQFIKSSDLGLLTTYDSETYFPRRAGILGEYLAAGIPVVVPAGCWLADQIEPARQEYLGTLIEKAEAPLLPNRIRHHSDCRTIVEFDPDRVWGKTDGVANHDDQPGIADSKSRLLVLSFDVVKPAAHGNYFRVTPCEVSSDSTQPGFLPVARESQVVGQARKRATCLLAFAGPQQGLPVSFQIENAYPCNQWQIENIRLSIVDSDHPIPRSAVGMIAGSSAQTPLLIREMINQYGHYRETAVRHSQTWFQQHDPRLTLRMLLDRSQIPFKDFQVETGRTANQRNLNINDSEAA